MKDLVSCIEELSLLLKRYRKEKLNEASTRRIFIDPLLESLGWNISDTDEVELEHSTVDNKFVDYALKINRKTVLYLEAKPLNDPLDVKSLTQAIGYASSDGVSWCVLTNGITYKVYSSMEKAEAQDKLLFEVSIDPEKEDRMSIQEIADQFKRLTKDALANKELDKIGEQVFTTGKIRKALDKLFSNPPDNFVTIVRSYVNDKSIKPKQIKEALVRLWIPSYDIPQSYSVGSTTDKSKAENQKKENYDESYHVKEKPREIIELYQNIDKFCRELNPTLVKKDYLKFYIRYTYNKNTFCSLGIQKSGLIVWLKLNYSHLQNPPNFIRDVSKIGHIGLGNIEVKVDNFEKLEKAKSFIKQSFEECKK